MIKIKNVRVFCLFAAGNDNIKLLEPSDRVRRTRFLRLGLQTPSVGTNLSAGESIRPTEYKISC